MSTETAPYGFCPVAGCCAPGVIRERGINGNDTCERGHYYPSRTAVTEPAFVLEIPQQSLPTSALNASFEDAFSRRCPNRSLQKLRAGQYQDPHTQTAWLLFCDGAEAALQLGAQ